MAQDSPASRKKFRDKSEYVTKRETSEKNQKAGKERQKKLKAAKEKLQQKERTFIEEPD